MTVNQSFTPAELKKFYQADYFLGREYINYVEDKPALQKTLNDHLRVVRRHVQPGGRILEVGCAYGFFLELIQKDYPRSVGVDVSAAGVEYARSKGLDAREGDLLTMRFEEPFDAVCLWDTIEHLPHPHEVMGASSRLLEPGGYVFLTTGDFGALLPRLQGLKWRQIHPPTHLFYFTRRSLRELCLRAGLDVVGFETATVHRRLGSALRAIEKFHRESFAGRLASGCLRFMPARLQNGSFPLNLGDTLRMVARKTSADFPTTGPDSTVSPRL